MRGLATSTVGQWLFRYYLAMDSLFPVREAPTLTDAEKLHDYLIDRNPEGVRKVLLLHGFKWARTPDQMREALLRLAAKGKEDTIYDLIEVHPDYDLIVSGYERKHEQPLSPQPVAPVATPKRVDVLEFSLTFDKLLTVFLFLVLVWLTLKIFQN